MKIVVYGLTITSSWGNGHATTYRALLSALAARQHRIEFIEKDVEWYRSNRDLPDPGFCSVHLYESWESSAATLLQISADADAIVIGSYFPDAVAATCGLLEMSPRPILFYDIDTPITLQGLRSVGGTEYLNPALIPSYSAYLSFTGGPALKELVDGFGARRALPFFCCVDPDLYCPGVPGDAFRCDLSYLGTYANDRQPKLERLLNGAAALLPQKDFIVAGPQYPQTIGWHPNVRRIVHLSPRDHPAFFSSSRFTLNLTRDAMVTAGYSPSVRLFEASACGAAIISDEWPGLEDFLTPGEEVLLPSDAADLADILEHMAEGERRRIGERARERILAEHTADHRAVEFERIIAECD